MNEQTEIALRNYEWLLKNREGVALHWESNTLTYGDGGSSIDELCREGFTPATSSDS